MANLYPRGYQAWVLENKKIIIHNSEFDLAHLNNELSLIGREKINNQNKFEIWGTGKPLREFLYVDDLADSIEFLMKNETDFDLINIGSGEEISIAELANLIQKVIGFEGEIVFDKNKPDGNPRKLIDSSKLNALGWKPSISLENGLEMTYKWFLENS